MKKITQAGTDHQEKKHPAIGNDRTVLRSEIFAFILRVGNSPKKGFDSINVIVSQIDAALRLLTLNSKV